MHRPEKDPNRFLYHYTTAKTAICHILRNSNLRFSPYSATNDPRETKGWEFRIKDAIRLLHITDSDSEKFHIAQELSRFYNSQGEILSEIRSMHKLLCFTCDDQNQPDTVSTNAGFYRGWGHPRMWAQYGEHHKGVCLMFEKSNLRNIIDRLYPDYEIYHDKVAYSNEPISDEIREIEYTDLVTSGIHEAILNAVENNMGGLFFKKANDWNDEHEYRWVIKCADTVKDYLYVPIEDSIRAIIMGVDVRSQDEKEIIEYGKKFKVRIYRIDWLNGCPTPDKGLYLPWVDDFPNPA